MCSSDLEMGRGTPTCLMGLPNDAATVNGRDTLRHDLWAEAVILLKANFPMLRTNSFTLSGNDELLGESLDLIEERRERAMIHLAY